MCWFAANVRWHQPPSATKHQGFAEETRVEHHRAIDIWDATLIGAILNTATSRGARR